MGPALQVDAPYVSVLGVDYELEDARVGVDPVGFAGRVDGYAYDAFGRAQGEGLGEDYAVVEGAW